MARRAVTPREQGSILLPAATDRGGRENAKNGVRWLARPGAAMTRPRGVADAPSQDRPGPPRNAGAALLLIAVPDVIDHSLFRGPARYPCTGTLATPSGGAGMAHPRKKILCIEDDRESA